MTDTGPNFALSGSFCMTTPEAEVQQFIALLQSLLLLRRGATLAFTAPDVAVPAAESEPEDKPKRKRRTNAEILADELAAKKAAEERTAAEVKEGREAEEREAREAAATAALAAMAALATDAPPAEPALPADVTLDELRALGSKVMDMHGAPELVRVLHEATGLRTIRELTEAPLRLRALAAFRRMLA